ARVGEVERDVNPTEGVLHLAPPDLVLVDELAEGPANALHTAVEKLLFDVPEGDIVAMKGREFRDAVPHLPGPDDRESHFRRSPIGKAPPIKESAQRMPEVSSPLRPSVGRWTSSSPRSCSTERSAPPSSDPLSSSEDDKGSDDGGADRSVEQDRGDDDVHRPTDGRSGLETSGILCALSLMGGAFPMGERRKCDSRSSGPGRWGTASRNSRPFMATMSPSGTSNRSFSTAAWSAFAGPSASSSTRTRSGGARWRTPSVGFTSRSTSPRRAVQPTSRSKRCSRTSTSRSASSRSWMG